MPAEAQPIKADAPEQGAEPASPQLPAIHLSDGSGVEPGTAVMARGIKIGEVEHARLDGETVVLASRLGEGHKPAFAEGMCARVMEEEGSTE